MAEKLREKIDQSTLSHSQIEKSLVLKKQNLYKDAVKTLKTGLSNVEKYNDLEYLIKGNYLLADVYKSINDFTKLEKTYLKIINLLSH